MKKSIQVTLYFLFSLLFKLVITFSITGIFLFIFFKLTSYFISDVNILSAFIGGIFSFVFSYYFFYKSNMIALVKDKKRKVYIPIKKELNFNKQSIIYDILVNPNTFQIKTINKIIKNEDYYLLSNNIKAWLNEYLNLYSQYSKLFESKYKVFITFLNYINKEYSININEMHYSKDFYVKCLLSIYKQNEEIIDDIKFTKNDDIKNEINIKNIIFNLCNKEHYINDLKKANEELISDLRELICVFNVFINIININYLKTIDYI